MTQLHLYVLLDRSGSMAGMAPDVVAGFNRLLTEQQADGPDALMTFVQFDSDDPQEVIADAVPIAEVLPLTDATFQPRGGTPLLDATGRLLGRAQSRATTHAARGAPAEAVVFATITDGFENASREFSKATIAQTVADRRADGWTFVFLGADVDAYAEAGGLGYDPRSTQRWEPRGAGAGTAMQSLSTAIVSRRDKLRRGESYDPGDFFEGRKDAEDDDPREPGAGPAA
jgi:hypothetical protein